MIDQPDVAERSDDASLRRKAARMLRVARQSRGAVADELVNWVLCHLPDSRAARRLRVDLLLADGNLGEARTRIAVEMAQSPGHWGWRYRHLQRLIADGEVRAAQKLVVELLAERPTHVGVLRLAATLAQERGDVERAIQLLTSAHRQRPNDEAIIEHLLESLLEHGRANEAQCVMSSLTCPHMLWQARVFKELGRFRDARDVLERELRLESDPQRRDAVQALLIEMYLTTGDMAAIDQCPHDEPPGEATSLSLARVQLKRGRVAAALACLDRVQDNARLLTVRLDLQTAISALLEVDEHLGARRLSGAGRWPKTKRTTSFEAWRLAMLGRIVADQRSSRRAGGRQDQSLMGPILERTVTALERGEARVDEERGPSRDRSRWRALCLAALGRHLEAAAAAIPAGVTAPQWNQGEESEESVDETQANTAAYRRAA